MKKYIKFSILLGSLTALAPIAVACAQPTENKEKETETNTNTQPKIDKNKNEQEKTKIDKETTPENGDKKETIDTKDDTQTDKKENNDNEVTSGFEMFENEFNDTKSLKELLTNLFKNKTKLEELVTAKYGDLDAAPINVSKLIYDIDTYETIDVNAMTNEQDAVSYGHGTTLTKTKLLQAFANFKVAYNEPVPGDDNSRNINGINQPEISFTDEEKIGLTTLNNIVNPVPINPELKNDVLTYLKALKPININPLDNLVTLTNLNELAIAVLNSEAIDYEIKLANVNNKTNVVNGNKYVPNSNLTYHFNENNNQITISYYVASPDADAEDGAYWYSSKTYASVITLDFN
ncbi:hypothetical protein H9M94_00195 [Mycoplasma sp. Pen4]|uniref:hypothetical protein n=1 Tax=Mycoplasma sp. Pen4 TaxID=640330 RepID=UPI001654BE44|nr:hypothetical protein [Mycoplasma sp. Pen4]QNM93687.1 hypothetical protein H9M94_00195 [Mycoplasma sp. Pen4]